VTVRLAHLSDIHITAPRLDWAVRDWFSKRYAAWINFRWLGRRHRFRRADEALAALAAELRRRRPDRVVFSGDATALGFESELTRAAELLGLADAGMPPGLAVPGNHDYCTRAAEASGLFERLFTPWQQGERVDGAAYPFAQRVEHLWLVAVNSCTGNFWPWDAGGSVGPGQRERLGRLLERLEPGPRILVTHYPVALASGKRERLTHGLRDVRETVKVAARGGVVLWLHGHRHHAYRLTDCPLAPFPVICAGSATQSGLWSYGEYAIDGEHLYGLHRVFDVQTLSFRDGDTFELELRCDGAL
jgi:3',5'-cyclic AMP phosphodiesterase CpdA